ncbi:hypothetical protein GXM_01669 [Nostoc sphaeroides CCNUC1]|uniref:Uncharacterized protein n=1 Tax=Nostoc sphaeroides CCNUC1 TaxID=2653204 RepID=A0A5P8VVN2_9NOSO|nr:hypothetical protein GXM_01669 [Nostoc sphaeroides CCNUC1]
MEENGIRYASRQVMPATIKAVFDQLFLDGTEQLNLFMDR